MEFVGLQDVAKKRVGQFSLGMGELLGIASALLGDPATLILDDPINGLDPDGIHWMRGLSRTFAAEGRTVFLSSVSIDEHGLLSVEGITAEQIGRIAAVNGIVLAELSPQTASLEEETEAAVYFCVLEALQNVQKYAPHQAAVRLSDVDGELRFVIKGDGVGFDIEGAQRGTGLTNMQDRLDALGGSLRIESSQRHGTQVSGMVPGTVARSTPTLRGGPSSTPSPRP